MSWDQFRWLFFGFSGRISRAAFLLAVLFVAVLQAFPLYQIAMTPEESAPSDLWTGLFFGLSVVSLWCSVALAVKRLHDFGKPGIFAITVFIPVVAILAFVLLCVYPSNAGGNEYGEETNEP